LEAKITNSEIDSDDLAFFAPAARTWKKRISISGNAKGTVDNISAKNLFVRAGSNTTVSGNLTMVGLPDKSCLYVIVLQNYLFGLCCKSVSLILRKSNFCTYGDLYK
jgi:hypothetical protein